MIVDQWIMKWRSIPPSEKGLTVSGVRPDGKPKNAIHAGQICDIGRIMHPHPAYLKYLGTYTPTSRPGTLEAEGAQKVHRRCTHRRWRGLSIALNH